MEPFRIPTTILQYFWNRNTSSDISQNPSITVDKALPVSGAKFISPEEEVKPDEEIKTKQPVPVNTTPPTVPTPRSVWHFNKNKVTYTDDQWADMTDDQLKGLNRNNLAAFQTYMKSAGFNPGVIDGLYGKNTAAAMSAWRADLASKANPVPEDIASVKDVIMPEPQESKAVVSQSTVTQTPEPIEEVNSYFAKDLRRLKRLNRRDFRRTLRDANRLQWDIQHGNVAEVDRNVDDINERFRRIGEEGRRLDTIKLSK